MRQTNNRQQKSLSRQDHFTMSSSDFKSGEFFFVILWKFKSDWRLVTLRLTTQAGRPVRQLPKVECLQAPLSNVDSTNIPLGASVNSGKIPAEVLSLWYEVP